MEDKFSLKLFLDSLEKYKKEVMVDDGSVPSHPKLDSTIVFWYDGKDGETHFLKFKELDISNLLGCRCPSGYSIELEEY